MAVLFSGARRSRGPADQYGAGAVSILARAEARALLSVRGDDVSYALFQSSRAPRRARCLILPLKADAVSGVSILARAEARALL